MYSNILLIFLCAFVLMSSNHPDLDTLPLSNPDVPCSFPCPYAGEKDVGCRIFPLSRLSHIL